LPQNSEKVGNRGKSSKNEKNLPVKITKLKNGIPGIPGISGRSAGKNEKTTSAFGPQNRLKSAGSGSKYHPISGFSKPGSESQVLGGPEKPVSGLTTPDSKVTINQW
jgi:hypothetical protein